MPAPADEPLAKAWINLYAVDKAWLFRRYGNGWSEVVRRLVRQHRRDAEAEVTILDLKGTADAE